MTVAASAFPMVGAGRRVVLLAVYLTLVVWLSTTAIATLQASGLWSDASVARSVALVLIPAVALTGSVVARGYNFAWSVFWTWAFLFLGLAPVFQMSIAQLPWHGSLDEALVNRTQDLILLSYAAVITGYLVSRPRRMREAMPVDLSSGRRTRRALTGMLWLHIIIVTLFVVLMGPALISGRAVFSETLVARAGVPGFGTVYFLSTAGAIILPAVAITVRRLGLAVPTALIVASVVASFVATNPLIGSRFLTGSYLIAVTAALASDHLRRWIPCGVVILFVTVFPTLDLLRGDGTGATAVAIADPASTLVTFDFDGFEMIYRAMSVHGQILSGAPSPVDLLVAPFLRWIPFLSEGVRGHASGPVIARATGMGYTNVSMPLWGEALIIGSWIGVIVTFAAVGVILSRLRKATSLTGQLVTIPVAALFFIVLRGSLYEVLGYMLLAFLVALWLGHVHKSDIAR